MKLSERSIRIKELIGCQVDMGTFGLVELELQAFDKEIEELKNCNLQNVSNTEGKFCGCGTSTNELDVNGECIICGKKLNPQNYC